MNGTNNIPTFFGNSTALADTSLFTVSTQLGVCYGDTLRFKVIVNRTEEQYLDTVICEGQSVTLHGITYNTTGIYKDTLVYSEASCDSIRYTLNLKVNRPVTQAIDTVICEGQSLALHGTIYTLPGSYTDTLYYVSGCDSIRYTVNLHMDSVKQFMYDTVICEGQTVSFHGTTYNQTGTYTDTLSYVSGCDSIRYTLNLLVKPLPVLVTTPDIIACGFSNISLTSFQTNPSGADITWTNSNTGIGLGASGSVGFNFNVSNTSDSSEVIVNATLNGCVGIPDTFKIVVKPSPLLNPIADITICGGDSVRVPNFTADSLGTVFSWTNDNTIIGLGASGTGFIAPFLSANVTDTAVVIVDGNLNGCYGPSTSFNIYVNPSPFLNRSINDTLVVCGGTELIIPTLGEADSILWWNSRGNSGRDTILPVALGTEADTFTYYFDLYLGACHSQDSLVIRTLPQIAFTDTLADTSLCSGTAITPLINTSEVGVIYWWADNGTTGTGVPMLMLTNSTLQDSIVTYTFVASNGSCQNDTLTWRLTLKPRPSIWMTTRDTTICSGILVRNIVFNSNLPNTAIRWSNSNTSIGLGANGLGYLPTFVATNTTSAPLSSIVQVYAQTNNGCKNVGDSLMITVLPKPKLIIQGGDDEFKFLGDELTPIIGIDGDPSDAEITWQNSNPNIGLGVSGTGDIPSFIPINSTPHPDTAFITLVSKSEDGCTSDTDTVIIIVENPCYLFIPEGFSPNGDGIDDQLELNTHCSKLNPIHLNIYNRYGEKVYEDENYKNNWNGIANKGITLGKGLPDGTYYYSIKTRWEEKEYIGSITLKR